MKEFILSASSELASDRTIFGLALSCAPPFKNTVPFFLLGNHPVYQRSSMLRLARTLRLLCHWDLYNIIPYKFCFKLFTFTIKPHFLVLDFE
jgi:hypothetical protein